MNVSTKEKIRMHFNRASRSYDQHCYIQNTVCERAINLLLKHKKNFSRIADFACGTGESTLRLTQGVDYEECYAIDFAENLLTLAEKKLNRVKNIYFFQKNFDEELFEIPHIDLVFCNMGLQWSENLSTTMKLFHQYLLPDGVFLFSIPISGHFPEIQLPFKLILPDHETILQILLESKFTLLEYEIKTLPALFRTQLELLKSLKAVGANYNKSASQRQKGLSKIKFDRIFTHAKNILLTHKIGIYLARRK